MHSWPTTTLPELPDTPARREPVRMFDPSRQAVVALTEPGQQRASMYVCGITPYDATHLGHAATYVGFDVLNRTWRDMGLEVRYASNVTDVDDPLLERANATGVDWRELAAQQTALYARDMTALEVIAPDFYVAATESIPAVVEAVEYLLVHNLAYRVPVSETVPAPLTPGAADIYADIQAIASFGEISHLDAAAMTKLFATRGGDPDRPGKRDALDPLLWRAARAGEPHWPGSGLGDGRPGWHIECAVIARGTLGDAFDLQGGGRDLVFPHHEMSTAHTSALEGRARDLAPAGARHHTHMGLVAYRGEKMSKSLGNLVLVSRLLESGYEPAAIRVALFNHRLHQDWEWFDTDMQAAAQRVAWWRTALSGYGGADPLVFLDEARLALRDNLDTPRALAAMDAWATRTLELARDGDDGVAGAAGLVSRGLTALLGIML
ncbi:cysteine--1-D-myo-inosityl 2-amino-2-deoxy-alpha-D-glucopyranoside ligase [Rarobacter incanus]|uniref:L-cysteine:1D-myo-inositol 2-amino-2-deoxy-alpha-D-glucopyranoside ligase n=1 Tax=Rarobacter incanus TaxID=153494 RepID=A0A542SMA8_9MICO|nr:cysteine--1-D-myo-inosityl 2-amino-2-deoxy-alpha-D-glucopyranoside ligase [Rarobacter incanus]TQK75762.1 L-cysteine:1D-myo-inositol 2-amino-2-deoxy-alpha-D-glucopyranoside ligase [Rarobacter incanus]